MTTFKDIRKETLTEKTVKGIRISRYLLNPTASDISAFIKNSKYRLCRLIVHDNNLYVWDGDSMIHNQFMAQEILVNGSFSSPTPGRTKGEIHVGDNSGHAFLGTEMVNSKFFPRILRACRSLNIPEDQINRKWLTEDTLNEKRERGQKVSEYLFNPSANEILGLYNKAGIWRVLRLIMDDDKNLYVWLAGEATHDDFVQQELLLTRQDSDRLIQYHNQGMIDPYLDDEDTRIGKDMMKKHGKTIMSALNKIASKEGFTLHEIKKFKLDDFYYYVFDTSSSVMNDAHLFYFRDRKTEKITLKPEQLDRRIRGGGYRTPPREEEQEQFWKMAGYKDGNPFINESRETLNGLEFLVNPTTDEWVGLYRRSEYQSTRFMQDTKGNLYVWDADDYVHSVFMKTVIRKFDSQAQYQKLISTTGSIEQLGGTIDVWAHTPSALGKYESVLKRVGEKLGKIYNMPVGNIADAKAYHKKHKKKLNEGVLNEKLEKSMGKIPGMDKYLTNPTAREIAAFAKRTTWYAVRFFESRNTKTLYVWDAAEAIHDNFAMNELAHVEEGDPLVNMTFQDRYYYGGMIDPYERSEDTRIGRKMSPRNQKKLLEAINLVAADTKQEVREIDYKLDHRDMTDNLWFRDRTQHYVFSNNKYYYRKLQEKRESFNNHTYLINPSSDEILGLLNRSQYGSVRFIAYKDDIYLWHARTATHAGFFTNVIEEIHGEGIDFTLWYDLTSGVIFLGNTGTANPVMCIEHGKAVPTKYNRYFKNMTKAAKKYAEAHGVTDKIKMLPFNSNRSHRLLDEQTQVLQEKSVKGNSVKRYLINPTYMELKRFLENNPYKSLRLLLDADQDIIYAWDANEAVHDEFVRSELDWRTNPERKNLVMFSTRAPHIELRANIDPFRNAEGSFVGTDWKKSKHYSKIEKIFRDYKIEPNDSTMYGTYYKESPLTENLQEKFIRGFRFDHLLNPTTQELIRFYEKTKYKSIRFLVHMDNLYVWDAFNVYHEIFARDELQLTSGQIADLQIGAGNVPNKGNIDPYQNDEGTRIGDNIWARGRHRDKLRGLMDHIEKTDKKGRKWEEVSGEYSYFKKFVHFKLNPERNDRIKKLTGSSLSEKTMKTHGLFSRGMHTYLVNPTAQELIRYYDRTMRGTLRFTLYGKNLYVWDAYYGIHHTFAEEELFMDKSEINHHQIGNGDLPNKGNLDPDNEDEGTRFGKNIMKSRFWQKTILPLMNTIERRFRGEFVAYDSGMQNMTEYPFVREGDNPLA